MRAAHNVDRLEQVIQDHFSVSDRFELLRHLYSDWDKTFFAGLCRKIADAARGEDGDPLCKSIFDEAGRDLAQHLLAMLDDISSELLRAEGGLPVVCIGSVWKSWGLLRDAFVSELRERGGKGRVGEVSLLRLKVGVPVGACYAGAKAAGVKVKEDYGGNTEKFAHEVI